MGWDKPDLYNQPEHFGLQFIGSLQWGEPDWDFNITAVLHDGEDKFYVINDSGCSCPMPFEDFTSLDKVEPKTKWEVIAELTERLKHFVEYAYKTDAEKDKATVDVTDICGKLAAIR